MELWIGALNLGFLYAVMSLGVFITFRIQDFPDITVDGSFTTGAATAAVLIINGVNPYLALIVSFMVGAVAGMLTGLIYTKLKVNGLLAGILVMIGLYSINLHIMGRSNIPLLNQPGFIDLFEAMNPNLPTEIWTAICLAVVMTLFWLVVSLFFKSDFGIGMRITGDNQDMASANGINVNLLTIFGLALSNGLVGLSGGMVAQYQGFADIGMGIGTIIIGLASVIIGESIIRSRSIYLKILSAIVGAVIFRFMIAFALFAGMDPIDLKLLTAAFVLLTLFVSKFLSDHREHSHRHVLARTSIRVRKYALAALALIFAGWLGYWGYTKLIPQISGDYYKIGLIQISDNGLLNVTRDSFLAEMERIGYIDGENCEIEPIDANGDLPTVNTVLDKYIMEDYDIVVTISTPCTQAAINKIKEKPVVFATVANPFIIGAGSNDSVHNDNVTGVYGWVDMATTLEYVRQIKPGPLKIGCIWDPAHANSEFNVEQLHHALKNYSDIEFFGATVSSSAEVYQAALSVAEKGIDFYVLTPDNTVYSAFDAVAKAAQSRKIPIVLSDIARLKDGALMTYGYNYDVSGEQAAHLVDRILKGENPKNIPFERYKKTVLGVNLKASKELGIELPMSILSKATDIIGLDGEHSGVTKKIGVVQFAMEPNVEICKKGLLESLAANGYKDGENIEIIYKNANADFSMINSIMQDFLRREVDIIVPLSTPCLQSAVQIAGKRSKPDICFTYIFDPYKVGAAKTATDHLPNVTGVSCFPPLEKMVGLIKEVFPKRKKIGIIWNSSEANSEAVVLKLRKIIKEENLELLENTVTTPSEVLDASRALALKGAEVFLNAGDNTLNVSWDSFVKAADEKSIPVFSVDAELLERGSFAVLGPDYYQTGRDGGFYLAKLLSGEKAKDIPIYQTTKTVLSFNKDVAKKHNFDIPSDLLLKADVIYEANTKKDKNQSKAKKLCIFLFNESIMMKLAENAVKEELKNSGILDEYNITIDERNAQNEFVMAQTIANDIVRQKYDYIVTLSTPALQVMANANKKIPHVFGFVTDPYRMGVAKSQTDHLPNITGVATLQPVESTFKEIRNIFPKAKKVGIIWNPGEACSETCTYIARAAAKKYNFELIETTVSATSEVMDALKLMVDKDIDVFITSGDNTVMLALESIAMYLRKQKIPYVTNTFSDVDKGAFMTVGADYVDVGRKTAEVMEKVIRGADPRTLPILNYVPEKKYLNLKLVKEYGLNIPESKIKQFDKVKK